MKLSNHFFKDVYNLAKLPTLEVAVDHAGGEGVELKMCNLQRVSPCEHVHALIFACARDMQGIIDFAAQTELPMDDETAASQAALKTKWVQVLTSVPTKFKILTTESQRFFASVQARIDADVEAKTIARKPAQWAMEVVLHQSRMHRESGSRHPPGAQAVAEDLAKNLNFGGATGDETSVYEAMTKTFVDNCLTIHDRLLKHPDLLRIVMKSRLPWDKVNKLWVLVTKAGSREIIQWVLECIQDAIENKTMSPEDVSARALKGADGVSLAHVLIARRQLRDQLFQIVQKDFASGWKPEVLVQMHQAFSSVPNFRASMKSLTWQRGFLPSQLRFVELLEELVSTRNLDKSLRQRLINKEGVSDWIDRMPEIETAMAHIKEAFLKETEPAVSLDDEKEPPKVAGEAGGGDGCQPAAGTSAPENEEVLTELPPDQWLAARLFPKTPWRELAPWVTQATRKVSRTCDLFVEPEDFL